MSKVSEAFPSKYLKAEDLNGKRVTVEIDDARIEEFKDGHKTDKKIILSFVGKQKEMVCNKTNAATIAKMYGDETDNWRGQFVAILAREVEFAGDVVLALRVDSKRPAPPAPASTPRAS